MIVHDTAMANFPFAIDLDEIVVVGALPHDLIAGRSRD